MAMAEPSEDGHGDQGVARGARHRDAEYASSAQKDHGHQEPEEHPLDHQEDALGSELLVAAKDREPEDHGGQAGGLHAEHRDHPLDITLEAGDRKSTRLNSSHVATSYAVFCLKQKRRQPGEA